MHVDLLHVYPLLFAHAGVRLEHFLLGSWLYLLIYHIYPPFFVRLCRCEIVTFFSRFLTLLVNLSNVFSSPLFCVNVRS
jgi:hypothetical protein